MGYSDPLPNHIIGGGQDTPNSPKDEAPAYHSKIVKTPFSFYP